MQNLLCKDGTTIKLKKKDKKTKKKKKKEKNAVFGGITKKIAFKIL